MKLRAGKPISSDPAKRPVPIAPKMETAQQNSVFMLADIRREGDLTDFLVRKQLSTAPPLRQRRAR